MFTPFDASVDTVWRDLILFVWWISVYVIRSVQNTYAICCVVIQYIWEPIRLFFYSGAILCSNMLLLHDIHIWKCEHTISNCCRRVHAVNASWSNSLSCHCAPLVMVHKRVYSRTGLLQVRLDESEKKTCPATCHEFNGVFRVMLWSPLADRTEYTVHNAHSGPLILMTFMWFSRFSFGHIGTSIPRHAEVTFIYGCRSTFTLIVK